MVSVIVPVYNVEPYLRECLDSIITQSYTDLQIIIIKSVISGTPNGVNVYQQLTGSGDGYLIRDGEYIPIQWHKPTAKDYFTFTTEDGSPVTLGVGKTFVSILPTISPEVIFE